MLKNTGRRQMTAEATHVARTVGGYLLPIAIMAAGVAGFLALAKKPVAPDAGPASALAKGVECVALVAHDDTLDLKVDGLVVPHREMDVTPQVGGRLVFKSEDCKAGRYVEVGTLLFEIETRDFDLEVQRLTAVHAQAVANLNELSVESANTGGMIALAEEDQVLSQNELRRLEDLFAGRFVSDSEIDRARRTELVARNTLASLTNQRALLVARKKGLESGRDLVAAQLEKAQLDLSRTQVTAPVSGVIVNDMVEQNAIVQPGAVLAVVEDTTAVEVKCSLRMEELSWLWRQEAGNRTNLPRPGSVYEIPKAPVTVEYSYSDQSETSYRWQGVLSRFESVGLDEQTRTVPCRVFVRHPNQVEIDGPDNGRAAPPPPALVRGMYVAIELHVEPPTALVRIPEDGLRPGKVVWLARNGQLEIKKDVHLIERMEAEKPPSNTEDSSAQISDESTATKVIVSGAYWVADAAASGLKEGDRLIVTPLTAVYEGMPIREKKQDEVDRPLGDS
jgi:multidrug efflux pump subunit AcrA (membrane-fusion protein)